MPLYSYSIYEGEEVGALVRDGKLKQVIVSRPNGETIVHSGLQHGLASNDIMDAAAGRFEGLNRAVEAALWTPPEDLIDSLRRFAADLNGGQAITWTEASGHYVEICEALGLDPGEV